ncbi:MAG: ion channel [Candidatus Sulfotelmatobacter sp.]
MDEQAQTRWDLLLLLSLLLVILSYPLLDNGNVKRLVLGLLVFLPVILATVKLSQVKHWVWPSVLLMSSAILTSLASVILQSQLMTGIKWAILAVFFAVTVVGLFDYLRKARSVTNGHLFTAASIYLLLGMQWFALYGAIEVFLPDAFLRSSAVATDHQAELLYFSLITLSTIGYGDIVPVNGEVRMLAALEGITGVLYVAITVALLVSAYKQPNNSS